MGQYEYDENGSIFYYFVVSFLALVLIPTTYSSLFGTSTAPIVVKHVKGVPACPCKECAVKTVKVAKAKAASKAGTLSTKNLLLILGWIVFAFGAYKVATAELAESGLWDPYEILGVSTAATEAEIKKKFRKLSLQFHPDKVEGTEEEKAAAATKYNELSKAQKVLTDEEARKTWDEFGHPDGRQALTLGIALPKYLVDSKNNVLVLFLYGAIFGIFMPIFVARWWYSSKNMNNDKICHETMGKFYKEVKADSNSRLLIDIICQADELIDAVSYKKEERALVEELAQKVATEIGKFGYPFEAKKKYTNVGEAITHKIQILLYSHLARIQIDNATLAKEQSRVAEVASMVVVGVLQICAARFWLSAAMAAIDLRQAIIQASLPSRGPLGQLPYLTLDLLKQFVTAKRRVTCPREFVELPEQERRDLVKSLSDAEYNELFAIAQQYPLVRVSKCNFSVVGEEYITPGSIVTLAVTLEHITPEEAAREKQEGIIPIDVNPPPVSHEEVKPQWFEQTAAELFPTHCPYFPNEKNSAWWIMMGSPENNRLICLGKINNSGPPGSPPKTCKLQFQAPPQPGQWKFHVFVKNDSSMGCDLNIEMTLIVVDVPEISAAIIEEEMSEPDEDTIAGQMAALKAGKVPGSGGSKVREEHDDSSDSEDDD
ncbi:Sec63 Brl domain-containing protein [Obelidium mucronatum]|nr:Sec63 Brl domain-containing protein [Obelidium mucronatum]